MTCPEPERDPLCAALAAGHAEAFSDLYDRFGDRLYRAALGMLQRKEDAEDAVQEVFAAIVRSRWKLAEVDDLTAYLFSALRRAAGRLAARRANGPIVADELARQAVDPKGDCSAPDPRRDQLAEALRRLPPEQREVIALKIDGELTFRQIADVLGISINTAASRYRYALEKLRLTLRD